MAQSHVDHQRGSFGRHLVYRRLGPAGEELTAGFIDKSAVREDQVRHMPMAYSLVAVIAGRGTYVDDSDRPQALSAGWCFQRVPGRRHSTILDPASGWQEVFLGLGSRLSASLLASGALVPEPFCWRSTVDPASFLAFAERLEVASDPDLLGLLAEMLTLIASVRPRTQLLGDAVEQARQWLAGDLLGRRDLRSWCGQKGFDYQHLRKVFRRQHGVSPGQFRIARRLEHACALLRYGHHSVAEVAGILGYPSPFAFSTQFRAHIGVPPSRYGAG